MTSLITCKQTQEEKIHIMLALYEQGLMKYGSRGRPSKVKLLRRYNSLFEPSVKLTDIASVLQDNDTDDILSYSDLPIKSPDTRNPNKCILYSDFSLNNSEFYNSEDTEEEDNTLDSFSSSSNIGDISSVRILHREEDRQHSCMDLYTSDSDDTVLDETCIDNTGSVKSDNSRIDKISESLQENNHSQVDSIYSSKVVANSDSSGQSEKLCYMEQLGLKPSEPAQMHCPKECENIFDSFQKFIAADDYFKNLKTEKDIFSEHALKKDTQGMDIEHGTSDKEADTKVPKPNRTAKNSGIVKHKNQNKMQKHKVTYSQGCLKKNLKMFARDLQIYAHQRKSSKSKVHVQDKPHREGNKPPVMSEWASKTKKMEQDEKLKKLITKLKGRHPQSSVSVTHDSAAVTQSSPCNTTKSQSNYGHPEVQNTNTCPLTNTPKGFDNGDKNISQKSSQLEIPTNQTVTTSAKILKRGTSSPGKFVVDYGTDIGGDSASETKDDVTCERKQYFMRQRRLLKFPSTVPSSMLKFIRSRRAQCGPIKKSANRMMSSKNHKGLVEETNHKVPMRGFQGGFSKKRSALSQSKNTDKITESDMPDMPRMAVSSTGSCLNSRKRKLSDSSSYSTDKTGNKRKVTYLSHAKNLPEENPERFLKEFSRHNWLINKYQIQDADEIETSEDKQLHDCSKKLNGQIMKPKETQAGAVELDSPSKCKTDQTDTSLKKFGPSETGARISAIEKENMNDSKTQSQVSTAPPLLIPVTKTANSGQSEIKSNPFLQAHSNIEQLPKIPPLKHDVPASPKDTCSTVWRSEAISTVSTDMNQKSIKESIRCLTNLVTGPDSIATQGLVPIQEIEKVPTKIVHNTNPENVIIITPSDDEHYNQVPTPSASSPDGFDSRDKPGLIPLQPSYSPENNNHIISECTVSQGNIQEVDQQQQIPLVDQSKPVQIVNTSFLPGSVLVVCNTNTPASPQSTVLKDSQLYQNVSPVQSQDYISHASYSSTVEPLAKAHTEIDTPVEHTNIKEAFKLSQEHSDQSRVVRQMHKQPLLTQSEEAKQTVQFVDLTKDIHSGSSSNKCGDGQLKMRTRVLSNDSKSNDSNSSLEAPASELTDLSRDKGERPELNKLRSEFLKFSKIFKKLTDIEEMKEKERQVLQEKKVQATMLMQTIKKQYENIKQSQKSSSEKPVSPRVSTPSTIVSNSEKSTDLSVKAHSKPNRVKLVIDCEPPPAHKNNSKTFDYVSLSNVESDFVNRVPSSPPKSSNDNTAAVYSEKPKPKVRDGNVGRQHAVDLSTKHSDTASSPTTGIKAKSNALQSTNLIDLTFENKSSDVSTTSSVRNSSPENCNSLSDNALSVSTVKPTVNEPTTQRLNLPKPTVECVPQVTSHLHHAAPPNPQKSTRPTYRPIEFAQRLPQHPMNATHATQHLQLRQQMHPRPIQPPTFTPPSVNGRSQETQFRPTVNPRFAPYRLGNLVQSPPHQNTLSNQVVPNMPPRMMNYGTRMRTPGLRQVYNSDFQKGQVMLGKQHLDYNVRPTQPDQTQRLYLQRPPISTRSSPQRPIPIRGGIPVMPNNSQDRILGPSAFMPTAQVNKTRHPNSSPHGCNMGKPPMAIDVNSQFIAGTNFDQHKHQNARQIPNPTPQMSTMAGATQKEKRSDDVRVQSMWMQFNKGLLKCGICQKNAMFVCSRCKEMPYCSEYCQTESWSKHAAVCGQQQKLVSC